MMNVYILEHGANVRFRSNKIVICTGNDEKEVPIGLVDSLVVEKTVQVTSQALCELSAMGGGCSVDV